MILTMKTTMSLQKLGLSSLLVILLFINIYLCFIIIHRPSLNVDTIPHVKDFTRYVELCVELENKDIDDIFSAIDGGQDIIYPIVFFIPPFACGTCVDNQIQAIKDFAEGNFISLTFISPENNERDLRVQLSDAEGNYQIIPYVSNKVTNESILKCSVPLLFKMTDSSFASMFVTSQWHPQMTISYITK